ILSHNDADYPTDPIYCGLMFIVPSFSTCILKDLKISKANELNSDEGLSLSIAKPTGNPERSYRVEKSTTTWGETAVWAYQFINITGHEKLLSKYKTLEEEKRELQRKIKGNRIVFAGVSTEIIMLLEKAKAVAGRPISILIEGETGTGKEVLAKYIHEAATDKNETPFIKLDCTTLPPNLIESELFGHEKGAFTGADRQRIGRLEQADGGTLFIDEISNLTLESQAKLLDFLQSFEITRIGGHKRIKVNVRVIAASNKSLYEMVKQKSFREDLFYRINTVRLHIPPLRERRSDIPILAELFLKEAAEAIKKNVLAFHPLAVRRLTSYRWPGNARELRSVIFEGAINASCETIMASDLTIGHHTRKTNLHDKKRRRVDKETIRKTVDECNGNISHAAVKLGIGRMTVYRKLNK
ncbi:MAG: sigma-54-dependent Fis family transcriptional regulator, partial [Fibrobacteres bacterium]|nr:sigma-54-dependent Fis family transcriptional regulator [Fibrobacterota bacterium]